MSLLFEFLGVLAILLVVALVWGFFVSDIGIRMSRGKIDFKHLHDMPRKELKTLLHGKINVVLEEYRLPNIRAAEHRIDELRSASGDAKEIAVLELLVTAYELDSAE